MTPEELVAFRKSLDLTQTGLAELVGLGLRAVQDLEAGKSQIRQIHILALERVAEKLAVTYRNPMLAPAIVRRDALDLVALIRGDGSSQDHRAEMLRQLEHDRKLRQQLEEMMRKRFENFELFLTEQNPDARAKLETELRAIPNFRLWANLCKDIERIEQLIQSGV